MSVTAVTPSYKGFIFEVAANAYAVIYENAYRGQGMSSSRRRTAVRPAE